MPRHNCLKKKEVATSIASEATTASRSPTTTRTTTGSTRIAAVALASRCFLRSHAQREEIRAGCSGNRPRSPAPHARLHVPCS